MNETVGQLERKTQNRIIKLFQDQLDYQYLGNWEERPGNANIEKDLLIKHLIRNGYSPDLINRRSINLSVLPIITKKDCTTTTKRSIPCFDLAHPLKCLRAK